MQGRDGSVTVSTALYLSPSSPFISAVVRPPTRGSGRPESVTATATMISFARGASAIDTVMPSKWLRT